MSISAQDDVPISDVLIALSLFLSNPSAYGGIILRGAGPVRDVMLEQAKAALVQHGPIIKIPPHADDAALLGGVDLTATLAAGRTIERNGLITQAMGGVMIIPMAERMQTGTAAQIALALDAENCAAILLDDGMDAEEGPPEILMERMAFHCNLARADMPCDRSHNMPAPSVIQTATTISDAQRDMLAGIAMTLGVGSVRALLFAQQAARSQAALNGRTNIGDDDIGAAVRLVLAPRATRFPDLQDVPLEPPEAQPNAPPPDTESDDAASQSAQDVSQQDMLLAAAIASIPPDILDQIERRAKASGKLQSGRSGQRQKSATRGRPLSARPGMPGGNRKLALIDSLRAAAPWQTIRARQSEDSDREVKPKIHIRASDLRVRHHEARQASLTIFAVDASGSSAMARLAEAKGAIELLLAAAYARRAQVALVAFRQAGAEVLLPPTRSLTRARRSLGALPGGGCTPLAAGLIAAQYLADAAVRAGQTPTLAVLTDGKANVTLAGEADRATAMEEAQNVAKSIARSGLHSVVIDISPRPREEAAALANALDGRYVPLQQAQSAAMVAAIAAGS